MKYYLIVGEASGDLHASHLMSALKTADPQADFRFFGGDLMAAVGGKMVKHYKELAYMGFIPVLLHLRTIFANMKRCKEDIVAWNPDVVILVDYPGFNLDIAKFVHAKTQIPVYYYISPKIWAWKEYRIKNIKRDVDELFSILPFEVEFFEEKHRYPIHYVGNPTVDEVAAYQKAHPKNPEAFLADNNLEDKPVIALLAGSRKQEIELLLPAMLQGAKLLQAERPQTMFLLPVADGINSSRIREMAADAGVSVTLTHEYRYSLMAAADAAVATSGTVVMEAALLGLPCVVLYRLSPVSYFVGRLLVHVESFSLPNILLGKPFERELLQDAVTAENIASELAQLYPGEIHRAEVVAKLKEACARLGTPGASGRVAAKILAAARRFAAENNLSGEEHEKL